MCCVSTRAFVSAPAAMHFTLALRGFSTSPHPVMVPPVPTPLTRMSMLPPVAYAEISSAVVLR